MGSLYEEDETLWRDRQIELLDANRLNEIDAVNLKVMLIEMGEYERMGIFAKQKNLIMHLLKWRYQKKRRSSSWRRTILNNRDELQLLKATLRKKAIADFPLAYRKAVAHSAIETGLHKEFFPDKPEFTFDEMLADDFWPDEKSS